MSDTTKTHHGGPRTVQDYLSPPQGPDELGRLGEYRILKPLGHGGMGVVFAAEDTKLLHEVAVKVISPELAHDERSRVRFMREARAAASINHPNVVTIHDVGEANGLPFLAMERLHGMTLARWLKQKGPPPISQTVRIGKEIVTALAAAHAVGLVHRDITPGNIFLLKQPAGQVKVLDFGLAVQSTGDHRVTTTGTFLGTPGYLSPEQARGDTVTPRSDLFSLGVVLYHLVSGQPPFSGTTPVAVMLSLSMDAPPPLQTVNPQVPAGLDQLIQRLMAKNPLERPASAAEVIQILSAPLGWPAPIGGKPASQFSTPAPTFAPVPATPSRQIDLQPGVAEPGGSSPAIPSGIPVPTKSPSSVIPSGSPVLPFVAAVPPPSQSSAPQFVAAVPPPPQTYVPAPAVAPTPTNAFANLDDDDDSDESRSSRRPRRKGLRRDDLVDDEYDRPTRRKEHPPSGGLEKMAIGLAMSTICMPITAYFSFETFTIRLMPVFAVGGLLCALFARGAVKIPAIILNAVLLVPSILIFLFGVSGALDKVGAKQWAKQWRERHALSTLISKGEDLLKGKIPEGFQGFEMPKWPKDGWNLPNEWQPDRPPVNSPPLPKEEGTLLVQFLGVPKEGGLLEFLVHDKTVKRFNFWTENTFTHNLAPGQHWITVKYAGKVVYGPTPVIVKKPSEGVTKLVIPAFGDN